MAQAIVARVEAAMSADEADRLVLIADPKRLGELRNTLAKPVRDRTVLEVDSHLTQATPKQPSTSLRGDSRRRRR